MRFVRAEGEPRPCTSCAVNGYEGTINFHYIGEGCYCHISPPCSYCTSSYYACDDCGWEPGWEWEFL